jgi:hypothetical protein
MQLLKLHGAIFSKSQSQRTDLMPVGFNFTGLHFAKHRHGMPGELSAFNRVTDLAAQSGTLGSGYLPHGFSSFQHQHISMSGPS